MASEPDAVEDAAETSLVDVSENRVRVLKALADNRRTASELARELDLTKSTVHGYLQDLHEDGLVDRHDDEDRLWVYYSLSARGRGIVSRDRLLLAVDLTTIASLVAAAAIGAHELFLATEGPSGPGTLAEPSGGGVPWTEVALAVSIALALLGVGLHVYLDRRRGDASLEGAS